MITLEQYFGRWANHPDATEERKANAAMLLAACSVLETTMRAGGISFPDNPMTESGVSGEQYGGFRPKNCTQGREHSSHKEGLAVDRYDPTNEQDKYLDRFETPNGGNTLLEKFGLYREHPDDTKHWCHLTIHAPKSGRRTFIP